jgi:DNA-binding NtrC family response regulator
MPSQGRILLIDNRESIPAHCLEILQTSGLSITNAENKILGLEKVRQESYDASLFTPGILDASALEFLAHLKQESPNTAILIVYEKADRSQIDEAIERGAFDCLKSPVNPDSLAGIVLKAVHYSRRALENSCIGQELHRLMLSQVLIGRSEAIQQIGRFIRKASTVDSPVLISGEPGTGKEIVARAIHRLSRRSNRLFVTVNCRKSSISLLENELFGHAKGSIPTAASSRTGKIESALGGTLFLDEIADIVEPVQEKILQLIQGKRLSFENETTQKNVDIRILSATCQDITRKMKRGEFREDLFYRINTLSITVPPLRERLEDIPLLADYYIRKFATEKQSPARTVSVDAMRSLQRREWPGNVREFIGILQRAVERCDGETIELRNFPPEVNDPREAEGESGGYLARMEKNEIRRILEQFQGNKTKASKYLGINRKTLREKMERYGLEKK